MNLLKASIVICLSLGCSAFAGPGLEVGYPDMEFGVTPDRTTLFYRSILRSTGDDTLIIDSISTGCECAVATIPVDRLAPGDSVEISLFWKIGRKRNLIGRKARIYYNSEKKPYVISLLANPYQDPTGAIAITAMPYRLEFGRYGDMSIDSMSFEIINRQDFTVVINLLIPPGPFVDLVLPDTVAASSASTGYAKLRPDYLDKEFITSFTVEAAGRKDHRLTIPIRRKIYGQ